MDTIKILSTIITIIAAIYKCKRNKRKPSRILFIDDEFKDFEVINTLRSNGYEIDTAEDIENLKDDKIKNAKIIFVDYKGVGKKFGKKQGIDLIKLLKKTYKKKKKIILFSAHNSRISKDLNVADEMIEKNAPLEDFINIIKKYS